LSLDFYALECIFIDTATKEERNIAGSKTEKGQQVFQLALGYYNHALGQVANLFKKSNPLCPKTCDCVCLSIANPFVGERIMNI